ncbi:hypothetical protein HC864_04550 [Candidatus Gracilibacteria bacterium]|nr:hypothetical protein [Candidatus Gracilibacteria bacterium]
MFDLTEAMTTTLQNNNNGVKSTNSTQSTNTIMLVLNFMGKGFKEWLLEKHPEQLRPEDFFHSEKNGKTIVPISESGAIPDCVHKIRIQGYQISDFTILCGEIEEKDGRLVTKNKTIIRLVKDDNPKLQTFLAHQSL